ncbi:unnamed protein product [Spirodela intermedia]|uniref:ENTH domain-containing protein n=1 Tax=Spirodela intermedia TaxID=51605 RepID=A0A7I8KZB9_SPIIN|nr:unnamed protein product [Spirodela intermedia]
MDFMKVLDQAVREIKREVNLKVLKVPEIEQKVLDATNDEPWGPHGSALSEISQATKKFTECQMVMNVLWTRLTDTGPNWRHVYKALSVIEYLLANGSERAVDDILEHSFQVSSLSSFEYVEPNGKDVGINVRKKVETILGLLNDKEKLQAIRNKAAANRDKYVGLSSSGISYKSSSSSYGSSNFQRSDQYDGLGGAKEDEVFSAGYKDKDRYGDEANWKNGQKDDYEKFQEKYSGVGDGIKSKGMTRQSRDSSKKPSATHGISKSSSAQVNTEADDFDDFDPRGSSISESASTSFKQVDLFGDSLIGDLMDAPATVSRETTSSTSASDDVDLFADATFVSATPRTEASAVFKEQDPIDLFGNQTRAPTSSSPNVDLFAAADLGVPGGKGTPVTVPPASSSDPFAAVSLNTFEGPDIFGDFTSHTDSSNSGHSTAGNVNLGPKKEAFQVKSGIWADSLSRGLIDLNLTAPKKVSLSDVGVVGGLSDGSEDKEKRPPASAYGGGRGPGGGFPSMGQQHFGGFH